MNEESKEKLKLLQVVMSATQTYYSGVNTTPENERVKALSEACLDRSY